MIRVWKCDFCCTLNVLPEKIKEHELKCSSNPELRKCWSCKYHNVDGEYGDSFTFCEIKLDVNDGERYGNCKGWKSDDPKLLRKLKLKKLNEI